MKTNIALSQNTVKKYGFFFSLIIMIGSMVGISIFFKNYQVFTITNGDSTLIIIAWILGAIISMLTAISFVDLAWFSVKKKMPFREWCSMFIKKKYGDFVGIIGVMYAYAIILPILYYYSYSFMVQSFGGSPTLEGSIIAMIVIPIGMFIMNIYAEKGSALFSKLTTILKLIPLAIVGLVGLFFTSNNGGFSTTVTLFGAPKPSANMLLFALPPILFSFDGFLTITNISYKTKNAKVNIPLSLVIGMIMITFLYLFITISQINHASPTIQMALNKIFQNNSLTRVSLFFVAISAFSVTNILTMSAKITCQSLIDDNILPFSSYYQRKFKKGDNAAGGFIMMAVSIVVALLLMMTQSILVGENYINQLEKVKYNNEAKRTSLVLDEFSNYPTYFFYPIYCSVIIANSIAIIRKKLPSGSTNNQALIFKNYLKNTSKKRRNIIVGISLLASVMIIAVLSMHIFYNIFYEKIIKLISNGNDLSPDAKWDLLLFLINLWLFQFIPLICLFRYKRKTTIKKPKYKSKVNVF